jgi:hypothetical protein
VSLPSVSLGSAGNKVPVTTAGTAVLKVLTEYVVEIVGKRQTAFEASLRVVERMHAFPQTSI